MTFLYTPHLIRELVDVPIEKVVTSPVACHSVLISSAGEAWVLGRNDRGQLGKDHAEQNIRYPVRLDPAVFNKEKVVTAATGRNHTLIVTDAGKVYGAGDNRLGQLGRNGSIPGFTLIKSLKDHTVVDVACGADFSVVLNDNGQVFTFGSLEFGQLGTVTSSNLLKIAGQFGAEPSPDPTLVQGLSNRKIVSVTCGTNHTLALDDEGYVFSWGFGGFGRLGHSEQKDLGSPRMIDQFSSTHRINRAVKITCGATCSMAIDGNKQLYLWGKWKNTGDGSSGQPWMFPKPLFDLNGWKVSDIAAGASSLFALVYSEKTSIAWGQVKYGELGYGDDVQRSSTIPQKIEPLEGIAPLMISAGLGHTLMIVKPDNELVPELPKWPAVEETEDGCVKCKKTDDEDNLLLCDKCDDSIHTYCAIPKLTEIPEGEWYCDRCHPPNKKRSHSTSSSVPDLSVSERKKAKAAA
ncbi:RCC1/BLIP-II protein [Hesseltinella vesiculosa]|uniref:RCC1/BLIP-II protein n=1 Tax=Hesseltinella vesiculosa TaxID=101127 RepID=A0A1X2GPB9_9FUNG|nr:RCC1/BLIP-II protein [Hesseltinella vesiculosa]